MLPNRLARVLHLRLQRHRTGGIAQFTGAEFGFTRQRANFVLDELLLVQAVAEARLDALRIQAELLR
jgi:hypothetical protein